MNITNTINNLNKSNSLNKEQEIKKAVGILKYNRIIALYPSVNKNIYNIDGSSILLNSRCIIINYSVSEIDDNTKYLFNKTTYICDLNFPGNITPQMLNSIEDITKLLNGATVVPIYAFNNPHVEDKMTGKFRDLGLTMVDLNCPYDYGVINFSGHDKQDQYNSFYKDIIKPSFFNPKFYIPDEMEITNIQDKSKSGILEDFIDDHTKIVKDIQNYTKNVRLYKNGFERKDRVINKRTMKTHELLLDIFSDLIFIPIEDLDVLIDIDSDLTLNIRKMTTFVRFDEEINNYYYEKMTDSITKTVNEFRNSIDNEKFYISIQKNEVLFSLNIIFKNNDNSVDEIRITNPLYKLYSQFAMNNESIVQSIEADAEYAKLNYIESTYRSDNIGLIENAIKTVQDYTNLLDRYKESLIMNHYESKMSLEDLSNRLDEINNK